MLIGYEQPKRPFLFIFCHFFGHLWGPGSTIDGKHRRVCARCRAVEEYRVPKPRTKARK